MNQPNHTAGGNRSASAESAPESASLVSNSGSARANAGGRANSGIQSAGSFNSARVEGSGDATAAAGGFANTGIIGSLTHIHLPPEVTWPFSVGRIPPLASAFQPREELRRRIDLEANSAGCGVVLTGPVRQSSSGHVLTGGGGNGKSQLGSWYARNAIANGVELVVWANAAAPGSIANVFAQVGKRVAVPGAGATGIPTEEAADAFLTWLQTTKRRWLVILDDVTDPHDLARWWPISHVGTGWALATTRRSDEVLFAAGRRRVDIDVYSPPEAIAYMRERFGDSSRDDLLDEELPTLVKTLGYLPLALSHAAAFMISQRMSTRTYLDRFRAEGQRLEQLMPGNPEDLTSSSATITITLLLTFAAAPIDSAEGKRLREAAAFAAVLDPNGHPTTLWTSEPAGKYFSSDPRDSVPVDHSHHLMLLERFGLVTIDGDAELQTARMHALTARAIREHFELEAIALASQAAADAIANLWSELDDPVGNVVALLRSNVSTITRHEASTGYALWREPERAIGIFRRAIQSWVTAGQYAEAIQHARRMITQAEHLFASEHSAIVVARIELVDALRAAGRLTDAVSLAEDIVSSLSDDIDVTIALEAKNGLVVAWRQAGRGAEATALGEEVVACRRARLGRRHSHTLASQNNLAVAYWSTGRVKEAVKLHQYVLKARKKKLGVDHADTLESRNNLAVALWQDGRTADAMRLGHKVFKARARILGHSHPRTLESQQNLASYLLDAGFIRDAVELSEHSFAEHVRVLGANNHRALNARHVLATCYLAAGSIDLALSHANQAVSDCLRVLGGKHRYTLAAQANLAACHLARGNGSALALAREAAMNHERELGPGHHNTIRAQTIMIRCLRAAGLFDEALAEAQRTVVNADRMLGAQHPRSVAVKAELDEMSVPGVHLRRATY